MTEEQEKKEKSGPIIWAVGGGKGGVGKSIVSILLAFWLSRMDKNTILVDTDLGGANLHTLLGIKSPSRTLNDFISKRYQSLEDICVDAGVQNLRLISGASEILSLANPKYVQKMKIIQGLHKLGADYIILDLGAGTSFNALDFFLIADKKITVLTPQPTSIQNAYGFVRNAVYRRLSQLSSRNPSLNALIQTAMNTRNELRVRTIKELLQAVEESDGREVMSDLQKEIARIQPAIVTNMTRDANDKKAGRIIKLVAEKYLMIDAVDLGAVVFDKQIDSMVSKMVPLNKLDKSSSALGCVYDVTSKLMQHKDVGSAARKIAGQ